MQTTIDAAGRLVVPKPLRDQLGITSATKVEILFRDGRLEIEPIAATGKLVQKGRFLVFSHPEGTSPLTNEDVNRVLDEVRHERVKDFLAPSD